MIGFNCRRSNSQFLYQPDSFFLRATFWAQFSDKNNWLVVGSLLVWWGWFGCVWDSMPIGFDACKSRRIRNLDRSQTFQCGRSKESNVDGGPGSCNPTSDHPPHHAVDLVLYRQATKTPSERVILQYSTQHRVKPTHTRTNSSFRNSRWSNQWCSIIHHVVINCVVVGSEIRKEINCLGRWGLERIHSDARHLDSL